MFCVKRFRPIIRVKNNSQEKFTILRVPQMGSVLLRLRRDFVIRKLVRKQRINIHALCEDFVKSGV